jgi:leukotriene-A4 hydrolase
VTELKNTRRFEFYNQIPIPGYLVAMAVGNIGFKAIGKRTGVYAEPE